MPFTRTNQQWGILHFERLGVLIPGVTLCVFFFAATLASVVSRETANTQTLDTLTDHLRHRIAFIQGAAEEFLQIGLQGRLQNLISSLASDADLISIHVVDEHNQVLASSRLADVGLSWRTLDEDFQKPLIARVRDSRRLHSYHDVDQDFLETYASLCVENSPDRLHASTCGFISYRVDIRPHMQAATLALRDNSAYYILGMAAVVLVSLGLIHLLVARRTALISSVIRKFRAGDRSARIDVERNDEISKLGHSINKLLEEIEEDEKVIRDGHERLHALFDNVIDSVIVINEKGIIENANPATEHIFGYTPDEVIGQNVGLLMPESVRSEHDGYLADYCESGVKNNIGIGRHVEALHKSGRLFPAELSIGEMHVHGERLFTGILRDVSEQVEMNRKMQQAYEELHQAHARLEQSARTDKLTNLYNRGHFDAVLLSEILRATRHGLPVSLMLLDADYFKRFNDHYGHLEGDRCLQEIAKTLQQTFMRSGEVVARYGGEEFAVILPHCDKRDAMNRAESLLNSIWDRAIPHEKSGVADRVTVSIGTVTYLPVSKQPVAPDDLIHAADEMLYSAKAAGRNQARHNQFRQQTDETATDPAAISLRYKGVPK